MSKRRDKTPRDAVRHNKTGAGIEREKDLLAEAERQVELSIQEQAAEHVDSAIGSLAKFAKGRQVGKVKPSASTVYNAAKSIIEFAGGRPETRDPRTGDVGGGVQIYIQQFGSGTATQLEAMQPIDVTDMSRPDALLAQAEHKVETVSKTYEVKDEE